MRRRKMILWTALLLCFALVLTIRTAAGRIIEAEQNERQVKKVENCVAALGARRLEEYRDLTKWYNHQLEQGTRGIREIYSGILDFGEGKMGVLEVQELNLRLPIYHGYTGKVGHDPGSPLPIGGRGNHTVLTLTEAYSWRSGQLVYIDILEQRNAYRVESVQVMPEGWSPARPTEAGQDLLSLIFDHGSTRTIIRCVRCTDLTVRSCEPAKPGWGILAAWSLVLLLPAFGWREKIRKA